MDMAGHSVWWSPVESAQLTSPLDSAWLAAHLSLVESGGVWRTPVDSTRLTITFRTAIVMPNRRRDDHHTAIVTLLPLSAHHPPTFPATPTPRHKCTDMMEHGASSTWRGAGVQGMPKILLFSSSLLTTPPRHPSC